MSEIPKGLRFFRHFAVIAAVVVWFGSASFMMACAVVEPATQRQCDANPFWCYCSLHPSLGVLGLAMAVGAFAGFVTWYERKYPI
jgi:hypothetical protein